MLRSRLFEGRSVSLIGVHGSLAYAYDGDRITVDLMTGRVVSRAATGPLPLLR